MESRARVPGWGTSIVEFKVCAAKQWILLVRSRVIGAVVGISKERGGLVV